MAPASQRLPSDYEYLLKGAGPYDVAIRRVTKDLIDTNANAEQKAGLEDLVERFSKGGPQALPRPKLNGNEGWFPSEKAAGKVRLQALKPWQLRAYGFLRGVNGKPTFIITGADCSKKQDRANQTILKAAGAEAFRVDQQFK